MTRRDDGFILIAALWLLAALGALAGAYSVYAIQTAPSAALPEARLAAEAAIRAGVELSAFRQLAWPKETRPSSGAFSTRLGAGRIDVVYRSESARIDLNSAPREVLGGLFATLGASDSAAGFLADRVAAWRGRLNDEDRRKETEFYRKAGLNYGPLGAPFDDALELSLLPGASPALVARAMRHVTVFSKSTTVNPFVADAVVLSSLPGMTPAIAKAFAAAAAGPKPDSAALANLAGPVKNFVSVDPNDRLRTEIVATVGGRRVAAEIVLALTEKGPAPYDILYWRDDFDGRGLGDAL